MKALAFRIRNFRSIEDSGWTPFSPDSITVLVGQNESGKSSVLEALHSAFSAATPTHDDFRIGAPRPEVYLRVHVNSQDIIELEDSEVGRIALQRYLAEVKGEVVLKFSWPSNASDGTFPTKRSFADDRYAALLEEARAELAVDRGAQFSTSNSQSTAEGVPLPSTASDAAAAPVNPEDAGKPECCSPDELAEGIWELLPLSVLFNEEAGRLPNTVDIDENGQPTGPGSVAATNFLKVAQIDLPALLAGDTRMRENLLNRANSRVSADFGTFWSQTIGKQGSFR